MEVKNFPIGYFKELNDTGQAEFLVSVFGNVDRTKDIVEPGSFAGVIARQARKPKFVPNHDWDVTKKLGYVTDWKETAEGLLITAQFNLDKQVARDVYSDFKQAPQDQEFSFSFDIAENGSSVKEGVRHITEFKEVFDVGPVGIGANASTVLVGVKSWEAMLEGIIADAKAGRRDSATTLKILKEAHTHTLEAAKILDAYIKESTPDNSDDGKSLLTVDSDFINTIETSLVLTDLRLTGVQS